MKARSVRMWSLVHRWTSLVSTIFLLLLCLTGLPLIFHHEIDEWLGYAPVAKPAMDRPMDRPKMSIDRIAQAALDDRPGKVLQYIAWDKDDPGVVIAYTNHAVDGRPDDAIVTAFDAYSAEQLGPGRHRPDAVRPEAAHRPVCGPGRQIVPRRHGAVVPGRHHLRRCTLLAVHQKAAIRASCGGNQSDRVVWLDWHNLLGITTIAWVVVVGGTGVVNTWAEPMLDRWRATELSNMVSRFAGQPRLAPSAPLDGVVANAVRAAPGMEVAFIAFPGTPFTSAHHFAAFMRGDQPLTSRLLKPILLDRRNRRGCRHARTPALPEGAVRVATPFISATMAACRSRSSGLCSTPSRLS